MKDRSWHPKTLVQEKGYELKIIFFAQRFEFALNHTGYCMY
jgi:hypothetical protein